ncbi:MAG: carboxypeptidase M32 [Tepidisphaerales bacterium]
MLNAYSQLVAELRQIATFASVGAVLGWDERTIMPPRAAAFRAEQSAAMAGLVHARFTAPRVGELLDAAGEEVRDLPPHSVEAANVRETKRKYLRQKKLPPSLVEELSRTTVLSEQAWAAARKANDYASFKPHLRRMLELKRQEIACYGYDTEPYDALLEDYEPGERAARLREVLGGLRGPLVELVGRVSEAVKAGRDTPSYLLARHYPRAAQESFSREVAERLGFDFSGGALAVSAHPFCSGIAPGDVRITTRYDENAFGDAFFSVLHETGHALYEQGLPAEHFGTPAGEAISLGIHESQSRMWENLVGRSRGFWQFWLPRARQAFPAALADVDVEQMYRAVNHIRPGLIRVDSDEATYNLHILLRFELETALLENQLSVDDLPAAWNERMKRYLGVDVPDDADGCLQDVHWSAGLIGYFPTYTLGNLYAAQFFERARRDLGDLDASFARGEFAPLLQWLRENIHHCGQRYTASQLVEKVTGSPLTAKPLLEHLRRRAAEVYGV